MKGVLLSKVLLLAVLFSSGYQAMAQHNDELSDRVESLLGEAQSLKFQNRDSSIALYKKAETLSKSSIDSPFYADILSNLARLHMVAGNFDDAESLFIKEYHSTADMAKKAANLVARSRIYNQLKEYETGLELLYKAEAICTQYDIDQVKPDVYMNIADFLKSNKAALASIVKNYDLAIEYSRKNKSDFNEYMSLYLAATAMSQLNHDSLKYHYLNQFLVVQQEKFQSLNKGFHSAIDAFINGENLTEGQKISQFKALSQESLKYNQVVAHVEALMKVAEAFSNADSSIFYYEKALSMSKEYKLDYSRNIALYNLHLAYKEQNQFEDALLYLGKFLNLNDSITGLKKTQVVQDLNVKYESEKKDKEIAQLAQENAEQELVAAERKVQRNGLIAVLMIVLAATTLIIYFFYNKNQKQRLENEISQQKIKDLEQQQQILSMNSMIEGQESERKRIAQDLHDGLGAMLSTIKMHFSNIQNEMAKIESLQSTNTTATLIERANTELRKVAHEMMPGSLIKLGLKEAVKELCTQLTVPGTLQFQFTSHGFESRLSETKEVMLYRAIQELMNNAIKHSDASEVIVQLMAVDNSLQVTIEDNGKGFDMETAKKGLGLKGIQSRVDYLKGQLHMESTAAVGSTFTIEIELD